MLCMDANLNNIVLYILVIDDNKNDQFFLKRAIGEIVPYAIVESLQDGAEAMDFLANCVSLPNLIFLDLNMVKLSGEQTIKKIRSSGALKKIPVVILTTSRDEDEKKKLISAGANDFYSKPDRPAELRSIVKEVVNRWVIEQIGLQHL